MKHTPTIEPIYISAEIRVRDFDANQYAIERVSVVLKGKNAGKTEWNVTAFCGSIKSLPDKARRFVVEDRVSEARRAAETAFDASGFTEKLAALPPKTGKKGQNNE